MDSADVFQESTAVEDGASEAENRSRSDGRRLLRRTKRSMSVQRFVEVMVVTDAEMKRFHGDDLEHYLLTLMAVVCILLMHKWPSCVWWFWSICIENNSNMQKMNLGQLVTGQLVTRQLVTAKLVKGQLIIRTISNRTICHCIWVTWTIGHKDNWSKSKLPKDNWSKDNWSPGQ